MLPEGITTEGLDPLDSRALMRLAWAMDVLRALYPKMTVRQASAFLAVSLTPGYGPTEYAKALGTVQPVASRWLLDLGVHGREHPGLGLLDRQISPESLRNVQWFLSPTGEALAHKLADVIRGIDAV